MTPEDKFVTNLAAALTGGTYDYKVIDYLSYQCNRNSKSRDLQAIYFAALHRMGRINLQGTIQRASMGLDHAKDYDFVRKTRRVMLGLAKGAPGEAGAAAAFYLVKAFADDNHSTYKDRAEKIYWDHLDEMPPLRAAEMSNEAFQQAGVYRHTVLLNEDVVEARIWSYADRIADRGKAAKFAVTRMSQQAQSGHAEKYAAVAAAKALDYLAEMPDRSLAADYAHNVQGCMTGIARNFRSGVGYDVKSLISALVRQACSLAIVLKRPEIEIGVDVEPMRPDKLTPAHRTTLRKALGIAKAD